VAPDTDELDAASSVNNIVSCSAIKFVISRCLLEGRCIRILAFTSPMIGDLAEGISIFGD
jgi:hypothetical protein